MYLKIRKKENKMNYKIGEILKVKKGHEDKCNSYKIENGSFIKITDIIDDDYVYAILDENKQVIDSCWGCFKDEDLEPIEKTMDNLEQGDILVDEVGDKIKILGICGLAYCISCNNNFDKARNSLYTLKELKDNGYKVYQEEPEETIPEMTVEEVQEKLGHKVKIVESK